MIRAVRPEDAAGVQQIYAPIVEHTTISFEIEAPTGTEMSARIARHIEDGRYPWLIDTGAGGVRGYAYASAHRDRPAYQWSIDVSVYVADGSRRLGVARGLYAALLDIVRELGYANAYAGIALPNAPSVSLHEGMGFRPVGVYEKVGYKLGAWRDVGWWALDLGAPADPPAPPLPFGGCPVP